MLDVLYLAHRVPYPPDKGDRIRTFQILRFLAGRCKIHLACLADEPVADSSVSALKGLCERLAIVPVGRCSRWLHALAALGRGKSASEGAFASQTFRNTIRSWAKETRFHAALTSSSSLCLICVCRSLRESAGLWI